MSVSTASTTAPGCDGGGGGVRRVCEDLCKNLLLAGDVRSRVFNYLTCIEGLQLSGEGEDSNVAACLSSASAVFLALYEQPPSAVEAAGVGEQGPGTCRLGELLRQSNSGVKDFMEHLTLVAGRLPQPLSGQLQADLRVMKEGIVVAKMLHGKYRQLWNERNALIRPDPCFEREKPNALAGGQENAAERKPPVAGGSEGATKPASSGAARGHDWAGSEGSWSPPSDPEVLPRMGWYLYLLTKESLGFRSSNASLVGCLQVILASLGVVIWNSSPDGAAAAAARSYISPVSSAATSPRSNGTSDGGRARDGGLSAHDAGDPDKHACTESSAPIARGSEGRSKDVGHDENDPGRSSPSAAPSSAGSSREERRRVGGGGGGSVIGGGLIGERALLAALSARGRCPADEIRAMGAHVVDVVEALLEQGIVVCASVPDSSKAPTSAAAASGGGSAAAPACAKNPAANNENDDDKKNACVSLEGGAVPNKPAERPVPDVEGNGALGSSVIVGRAGRVAGVFHPSVAAENAARLDSYYWASVSARGKDGDAGGIRVLDEAFVLTPSLRDTVGTPRCGSSTPRRPALTPSVSRASRQLFQDYQKVSTASASAPSPSSAAMSGLGLSFGSGLADTPSSVGVRRGMTTSEAVAAGGNTGMGIRDRGAYLLESPVTRSTFTRGGGGGCSGTKGSPVGAPVPPATPVMAAMETVRWMASLDSITCGPPGSLLRKLEKCATASVSLIQERLGMLLRKLDGPAPDERSPPRQGDRNSASTMPFSGSARHVGRGASSAAASVEAGILSEAKGKAEALYYVTLEALLDAETRKLGAEDHSRLLRQETLHGAILACCLEAVLKASSLLSLTFPWVLRRMEIDALDLCKVLESFARFCPGLPMNLKYHLLEVQTEIVERLALEDGAGVFRLIKEEEAAGTWPVPALQETDVAPPTSARLATLETSPRRRASSSVVSTPGSATPSTAAAESGSTPARAKEGGASASATGAGDVSSDGKGEVAAGTATAKAKARGSTLDLYFRKLMQRAAEVVAELCLRRLQLPGDTADQVWTVVKRCVARRTEILKDRHLHHVVLCSTYSVCKVNGVTPEVTFKRIIEQYKQLTGAGAAGALSGSVSTSRLSVIKDILLGSAGAGAGGSRRTGGKASGGAPIEENQENEPERGDIIKFYNKVYIPEMKQFILEFKNFAGQQRGAASISNARDAVRVAKRVCQRAVDGGNRQQPGSGGSTPTAGSSEDRCRRRAGSSDDSPSTVTPNSETTAIGPPSGSSNGQPAVGSKAGGSGSARGARGPPLDGDGDGDGDGDAETEAKAAVGPGASGGSSVADEVVAAGAALSALSTAPHPQTPLVSSLPTQRMASPKRVQENVYLTTVMSPARAGPGGFPRPLPAVGGNTPCGSPHSSGGGHRLAGGGDSGGGGKGKSVMAPGSSVYAFGESPSRDLQLINRAVRDDGLVNPPSAKKPRGSAAAMRAPR